MKAVTFDRTGGPEVLHITEVPTPQPRPGQVLIKTAYAGINFADIGRRTGLYGLGPLPAIPGRPAPFSPTPHTPRRCARCRSAARMPSTPARSRRPSWTR